MGPIILILILLVIPPASPDPNDSDCLAHLYSSLSDPAHKLGNWTQAHFSNPCPKGSDSPLFGATCNNGRIFRLSLSNLSLTGSLSPLLSRCTNLQTLDLSSNSLTGQIPPDIKDLTNLVILNLSNNHFSGQIPVSLYLCAYLNVIDLHNNQLVGPIPQQLSLLIRLNTFDVSYNHLSGMIPPAIGNRSGNLPRFNSSSFAGNKDLYGYPLQPYQSKGLSVMAIVLIGLGSGLLSLIVSFTVVCVWLRVSEQKLAAAEEGKITQLMPEY